MELDASTRNTHEISTSHTGAFLRPSLTVYPELIFGLTAPASTVFSPSPILDMPFSAGLHTTNLAISGKHIRIPAAQKIYPPLQLVLIITEFRMFTIAMPSSEIPAM